MLYHFLYPLKSYFFGFNVFRYITFRSGAAAVTALLISFIVGPIIIRWLQRKQIGELIRDELPSRHLQKKGTPTMGGFIILIAILVPVLLFARLDNIFIQVMLLTTVWMGGIGFLDDYLKIVKKKSKGLIGRYKLAGQISFGVIIGLVVSFSPVFEGISTRTFLPFFKSYMIDFGWLYLLMVICVIAGTSNAVNLTDGLDGLVAGLVGIAAIAWAAISYITGRVDFSTYLNVVYLKGAGELTVYCAAMAGACLGFLWFNAHPAEVFMGDTGSMTLGGALGALAILTKKELLLLIIGGVFVAESLSVIIQVISYRYRGGKRVFKMAPLHHHFELLGWHESKIVVRFWIIGILLLLLSLTTFKVR
ncbi:phospho-N-acetylmuramoyl-pentapeptide-transferase [candidate division KSB1 bacterium]|nr:MAG: phospho-N-acetylmuramoyl-pentapeptide-transferase [candidate division KSB1 bacterium]RKY81933.1 MAG: phospho-N-acetylmuramoyl-pentapeptide-transferase [candidate division KSB1 bacterium]RKY88023.1 MAG: phospho-N-acetylmuramoyl-pentapeptide-transferase [candidate division KSB1 bacterium]